MVYTTTTIFLLAEGFEERELGLPILFREGCGSEYYISSIALVSMLLLLLATDKKRTVIVKANWIRVLSKYTGNTLTTSVFAGDTNVFFVSDISRLDGGLGITWSVICDAVDCEDSLRTPSSIMLLASYVRQKSFSLRISGEQESCWDSIIT